MKMFPASSVDHHVLCTETLMLSFGLTETPALVWTRPVQLTDAVPAAELRLGKK